MVAPGDEIEVNWRAPGGCAARWWRRPAPLSDYGRSRCSGGARRRGPGHRRAAPVRCGRARRRCAGVDGDADRAAARRGIQTTFLTGLAPTRPDLRMVGYARTLRYVAIRADVRESMQGSEDAQKRVIESISAR